MVDTSKTMIKMLRESKDIQRKWIPKPGDFCFAPWMEDPGLGNYECTILTNDYNDRKYKGEAIWIPHQGELQDMFDIGVSKLLDDFYNWATGDVRFIFSTMEQLWLGFTMLKKFKKSWSGDKWERIKNAKKI